jgi:hypothetical protein
MKAAHEVTISQAAFIKAAKPTYRGRAKPKRSVTVFVPKDTQISAEGGQLVIETPNLCTLIPMTGHWTVRISVDPGLLARMAKSLKPGKTTSLVYAAESLIIDNGARTLPAKIVLIP